MNSERWGQIKRVFNSALEIEPGRRDSFLRGACGADQSLLQEVGSLLQQESQSDDVFGSPPAKLAAAAITPEDADNLSQRLSGRTFSNYQVEKKIGQGGMGEVYRARDVRLGRTVALKILPLAFAADSDRMRRFIREAKAASALNHPNVAIIFEVGEAEGVHFISMEYISGQTLSEHSGRRALHAGQVIEIGIQLADALEEAHGKGIIHRDLKPANVMMTARDQVKVLDFGLAKVTRPAEDSGDSATSLTGGDEVIGTAAFMSPEQVLGHSLDHRTDIFSLGTILYELATGRSPFAGGTTTEIMDRILHKEPEGVREFNRKTPAELERIIRKCLEKDRSVRYQTAADLRADLQRLKRDLESVAVARRPKRKLARPAFAAGLGVVPLLALAGWLWFIRQPSAPPDPQLVPIPLTAYPGFEHTPSFSPDGSQVAFVWDGGVGNWDIYLKQIGVEPPFRLTSDPADDFSPAWSPDGRYIAFVREDKVMLVPQRGGQERFITNADLVTDETTPGSCIAWTPDSKWLAFPSKESPQYGSGLSLVSIETLEKRRLTRAPAYFMDTNPAFLSDGRALAFTRCHWETTSDIRLLRLGTRYEPLAAPESVFSCEDSYPSSPAWTPDGKDILFSSKRSLWRVPASGAEPKRVGFASDALRPAISTNGNRLAYSVFRSDADIWQLQLDEGPNAIPSKLISSTRVDDCPTFSPDGKKIAFHSDRSGSGQVWVCDRDGSNAVQLTSLEAGTGETLPPSFAPRWSPDGRKIVFSALIRGLYRVLVVDANGGIPRQVTTEGFISIPWPSWSADSQSIHLRSITPDGSLIWKVPAAGGEAVRMTFSDSDQPQESPDGKYLYYTRGCYGLWNDVWRIPVGSREAIKVVDGAPGVDGPYAAVKDGIYFFSKSGKDQVDVCFLSFATGMKRKIQTIRQAHVSFLAVSPDRRTLLYTQAAEQGSDLMLVENFR